MKNTTDNFLTDSETKRILRLRAVQLAEKKTHETAESNLLRLLTFQLASETYGIELKHIRVVVPLKEMTLIPGTPDFISGIINVRGEIISIVDFRKIFDLPESDSSRRIQIIIIHSEEIEFGIQADHVLGVRDIPESDIQTSLPTLTDIRLKYLKGVTGDGMVVLDGEKILSDSGMVIQ
jgi:purine-binding chemotaxis protein CheW